MNKLMENCARNIRLLRTMHHLTPAGMALELHCTKTDVREWECGQAVPSLDVLLTMAEKWHVTIDHILFDTKSNHLECVPICMSYKYKQRIESYLEETEIAMVRRISLMCFWLIGQYNKQKRNAAISVLGPIIEGMFWEVRGIKRGKMINLH